MTKCKWEWPHRTSSVGPTPRRTLQQGRRRHQPCEDSPGRLPNPLHRHHDGAQPQSETVARRTVTRRTVARRTVARRTLVRRTVARKTVARWTVVRRTIMGGTRGRGGMGAMKSVMVAAHVTPTLAVGIDTDGREIPPARPHHPHLRRRHRRATGCTYRYSCPWRRGQRKMMHRRVDLESEIPAGRE